MKLIFNHLLLRLFDLATERLVFLAQQKDNIRQWTKAGVDDKGKHIRRAEVVIENLLRNKDLIQGVLSAVEESKPTPLSAEQDSMVADIRRVFRWGLSEYKSVLEYAGEVGFNTEIVEGLKKDQRLASKQKQEPIQDEGEGEEEP